MDSIVLSTPYDTHKFQHSTLYCPHLHCVQNVLHIGDGTLHYNTSLT